VLAVALGAYANRCKHGRRGRGARLQWAGWGAVVAALVVLVAEILHLLLDWPPSPAAVPSPLRRIPVAVDLSSWTACRAHRSAPRPDHGGRGLVTIVSVIYLIVVLGLGDAPDARARDLLGLSWWPRCWRPSSPFPRKSLDEAARRRVYGDRRSPDEAIQTFGTRMSRSVPMDEPAPLAESLAQHAARTAEVWTGSDGVLELVVSVLTHRADWCSLAEELPVVSRARVSGNAWLQVYRGLWPTAGLHARAVSVVHSGSLLGLIVAERSPDAIPFTDESERQLTELAPGCSPSTTCSSTRRSRPASRRCGATSSLQLSRRRIVTAAESRRQIRAEPARRRSSTSSRSR
jgi:hypothetical protein